MTGPTNPAYALPGDTLAAPGDPRLWILLDTGDTRPWLLVDPAGCRPQWVAEDELPAVLYRMALPMAVLTAAQAVTL